MYLFKLNRCYRFKYALTLSLDRLIHQIIGAEYLRMLLFCHYKSEININ